jgi:hypothetical protein
MLFRRDTLKMLEQIKLEDKPQKEYDRLTNPKEG